MRSSSQSELMRMVFSVMLSTVRSFMGGILTWEGSISEVWMDQDSMIELEILIYVVIEREQGGGRGGLSRKTAIEKERHPAYKPWIAPPVTKAIQSKQLLSKSRWS